MWASYWEPEVLICVMCVRAGGLHLSSRSSCVGLRLWLEALHVSQSGFNLSAYSSWQPSSCWHHIHTHTHTCAHMLTQTSAISMVISREPERGCARVREEREGYSIQSRTSSLVGLNDQRYREWARSCCCKWLKWKKWTQMCDSGE